MLALYFGFVLVLLLGTTSAHAQLEPDPEMEKLVQKSLITRDATSATLAFQPGGSLHFAARVTSAALLRLGTATADLPTSPGLRQEGEAAAASPAGAQLRALVLDDGRTRLGLVALPVWGLHGEDCSAIAALQRAAPPGNIMAIAAHVRGPATLGMDVKQEAAWLAMLKHRAAAALDEAAGRLAPATPAQLATALQALPGLGGLQPDFAAGVEAQITLAARTLEAGYPLTTPLLIDAAAGGRIPLTVDGGVVRARLSLFAIGPLQLLGVPGAPDAATQAALLSMLPGPAKALVPFAGGYVGAIKPAAAWQKQGDAEQHSLGSNNALVTLAATARLSGTGGWVAAE